MTDWKAELQRIKSDVVRGTQPRQKQIVKIGSGLGKEAALRMLKNIRDIKMVEKSLKVLPRPGTALAKQAADNADKMTKTEAVYHEKSGKPSQSCGACQYFDGKSQCRLVAGKIAAEAWCKYFTKNEMRNAA